MKWLTVVAFMVALGILALLVAKASAQIYSFPGPGTAAPHSGGGGSVAFDAVGPSSGGATSTSGSATWTTFSLTWSHTCGASATGLVVGATYAKPSDATATLTATYNGVSMTAAGSVYPNNDVGQGAVYLFTLGSCPSGAHNVVVTATYGTGARTTTDSLTGGSLSFTGSTGFGTAVTAYGSSTASAVTVTSASGHMVADVVGTGTSITSSSQTLRWSESIGGGVGMPASGQSTAPGASSVTMGYTVASDTWGIIGVDVQ